MRILLDEHLDIRLHRVFGDDFEAETVAYRGWKGVANGDLLQWAADEYDGFLTFDRGIPHQQNIEALRLRCIVMKAQSDDYEDLAPLIHVSKTHSSTWPLAKSAMSKRRRD